jgi:hypothetical protein
MVQVLVVYSTGVPEMYIDECNLNSHNQRAVVPPNTIEHIYIFTFKPFPCIISLCSLCHISVLNMHDSFITVSEFENNMLACFKGIRN